MNDQTLPLFVLFTPSVGTSLGEIDFLPDLVFVYQVVEFQRSPWLVFSLTSTSYVISISSALIFGYIRLPLLSMRIFDIFDFLFYFSSDIFYRVFYFLSCLKVSFDYCYCLIVL